MIAFAEISLESRLSLTMRRQQVHLTKLDTAECVADVTSALFNLTLLALH